MRPNARIPRPLILAFLLFAIGIGVSGYLLYESQKKNIKKVEENELSAIADLKVSQIVSWRMERIGDANVISQSSIIASRIHEWFERPQDSLRKEEIYRWMRSIRENYNYQSVILVDSAGKIRVSVPDDTIGAEGKKIIDAAMRDRKVVLSNIYRSLLPGNPVRISLVSPLFVEKGGEEVPIGAVFMRINPYQFLYPLIESWPTPSKTSETVLARREGDDVLYLNELRHKKNTALSFRLPLSRRDLPAVMAVQGQRGIVEGLDYRGVHVVAALRAIPDTTWLLVAKIDADEIFASLRERMRTVVFFVSLLVISSGLLLGLLWRRKEGERMRKAHDELEMMVRERTSELEEARRQNELILNSAGEGIYFLDRQGRVISVNPAALNMLGYDAKEVIGKFSHQMFHHTKKDGTPYPVEECATHMTLLDGAVHHGSGEILWRKDGSSFPIDFVSTPVKDGVLSGVVVMFKDITERMAAEEEKMKLNEALRNRIAELETANKELGAFSYNVSHDLRAPLRAIAGFSSIMLDEYAGSLDDEGKRLLGVIRSNAQKMGQLVDGLTEYLRLGRKEIILDEIDMRNLVEEVSEGYRTVSGRTVQLDVKEMPSCRGDKAMVRQVLANLISNATKFTRPREKAEIEVGSITTPLTSPLGKGGERGGGGEFNVYYVKDNGVGFDMRYESKLFNVFQHLHGMEEFEGTGIGLAIVKRIIEKHGGRVWAEGKVGKGATFYFTLPKV